MTNYLQFDPLSIQFDGTNLEIDTFATSISLATHSEGIKSLTNGGDEARRPSIVTESEQQTRLSHP